MQLVDSDDVKLEPYEIYDQVECDYCGIMFNNKKSLLDHIYNTHRLNDATCARASLALLLQKANATFLLGHLVGDIELMRQTD